MSEGAPAMQSQPPRCGDIVCGGQFVHHVEKPSGLPDFHSGQTYDEDEIVGIRLERHGAR